MYARRSSRRKINRSRDNFQRKTENNSPTFKRKESSNLSLIINNASKTKSSNLSTLIQNKSDSPQIQAFRIDKKSDDKKQKVKLTWWERSKRWAFKKAMGLAGIDPKMVMGLINKSGPALGQIFRYPKRFVNTLISALQIGFSKFRQNIGKYIAAGIMGWIFGTLSSAGIQIPKKFTLSSFFGIVLQVMGVTVDYFKKRLAKKIGDKNIQRLEQAFNVLSTFIKKGIGGVWKLLKNYLTGLRGMVINSIKDWVITKVVFNAVTKIVGLFNPVSGLVAIIKTIYNVVKFLIKHASQLTALFGAVAGSMYELAYGKTKKASAKILSVLAGMLPLAIGFFANFIGLSGIGEKVKNIIGRLQKKVNKAIDKGINWIASKVGGIFKSKGGKATSEERHKKIIKRLSKKFKKDDGPKKLNNTEWMEYKKKLAKKMEKETNPKLEKGVKLKIDINDAKGFKRLKYKMKIALNTVQTVELDNGATIDVVTLVHGTTLKRAQGMYDKGPDEAFEVGTGVQGAAGQISFIFLGGSTKHGNPSDYARNKVKDFEPNDGVPALLFVKCPTYLIGKEAQIDMSIRRDLSDKESSNLTSELKAEPGKAINTGAEVSFEPGHGLEELKRYWSKLKSIGLIRIIQIDM